ncbi:MAG: transcription initiation factor IIB [Candidatus Bathyarchaeota archaeon]|nr:MAG: transcription initiation factor IIB [Candidatus Bathyarchaeota archaeon]
MTEQIVEEIQCSECGSSRIVLDRERGESICGECGFVLAEDMLSSRPEWRAFTPEEQQAKRRAGAPADFAHYNKGLPTTIKVDRDAFGRPLPSEVRSQMWRLRKWHIRSQLHASESRNLMHAMNELERLSDKLHIPAPIRSRAAIIYRRALDKGLVRGRSIAAMIAGALYIACRLARIPKSLKEIGETSVREEKEVARSYRLLLRRLKIEMPIHNPLDYVSKVAGKAGLGGEIEGQAVRIIRKAQKKRLTMGKDPRGVAATALYIACRLEGKKVTQKEIAEAADITEVTLRNRKRGFAKGLNLEV